MYIYIPISTDDPRTAPGASSCDGSYESPTGNYMAEWRFNNATNMITFTISARLSTTQQQWLAIGLNTQPAMVG